MLMLPTWKGRLPVRTAREDQMTAFGVLFLVATIAATFYFTPAR